MSRRTRLVARGTRSQKIREYWQLVNDYKNYQNFIGNKITTAQARKWMRRENTLYYFRKFETETMHPSELKKLNRLLKELGYKEKEDNSRPGETPKNRRGYYSQWIAESKS